MKKSVLVILLCGILVLGVCGVVQAGNQLEQGRIQQKQVIAYRGELVFGEVSAAGEKEIYICPQDRTSVYRFTANKIEQYPLPIPEGMLVAGLSLDEKGRVQVLLEAQEGFLPEGAEYYGELWTADAEGNVLRTMALTKPTDLFGTAALYVSGGADAKELEEKLAGLETPGEADGPKEILGRHILADGKYLVIDTFMENGDRITQFSFFEED